MIKRRSKRKSYRIKYEFVSGNDFSIRLQRAYELFFDLVGIKPIQKGDSA